VSETLVSPLLRAAYDAREEQRMREERERCETSLSFFIKTAWPTIKPMEEYKHNWHIDAVCERLEAVSSKEVKRLQVWVPPGTMKTMIVSIFWPAWEWINNPWIRYWGASYEVRMAGRIAALSRDVMMSDWYQRRWGDRFRFTREGENYFGNDMGGTRLATAPQSTGSGEHGHRILIDDPINAKSADATSGVVLKEVRDWYDGTVVTRGLGNDHARVIIMQRLHEEDLASHVLEKEDWDVLCLPERYEPSHPFTWPDDPRKEEGELLWPNHRDENASNALAASLTPHRAAGQLQQRPAAKEGDILQTRWWRFYDPKIRTAERWSELPAFSMVVISVDCPLKDAETNDNISIQAWGVHGKFRYLLDLRLGKMSYPNAKRAVTEMMGWTRRTWPRSRHVTLIESGGYGKDLITDLKNDFTGMTTINPGKEGDKGVRADRASEYLESGFCFLPGYGPPWQPSYEPGMTPQDVSEFVHNCSRFPNATHDDDVDAWSQMINWLRGKQTRPVRTSSASKRRERHVVA
jgi:predicted phage terminase large subunit-like protein